MHGPLSLILMLSVLRSQLGPEEIVHQFDYRNLAPLLAEREMEICVKKDGETWKVWILDEQGRYAARGTALIGLIEHS